MTASSTPSQVSQIPMTTATTGSVIAGQKITVSPASRLSTPVAPVITRPGPAPPATTRSTSPCMTQNRPTTKESSTTVTETWPRQYRPARVPRIPASTCVLRCAPVPAPAVTPRSNRSTPVTTRAIPSRTAVATSEAYGRKRSRKPRASIVAATARVARSSPRAASRPARPGNDPVPMRAPDEVIGPPSPRHPYAAIVSAPGRNGTTRSG